MQYNITYRQKDKGWQYIISYKDINGDWKQKSKQGFDKKKDAQKAADERINSLKKEIEVAKNLEPEYEGITFGEFAERLIEHEKIHKAQNSISVYETAIKRFKTIKGIPLSELKYSDIQKCVDKMVQDGLKLATIKTMLYSIKYMLNQAVKPYKVITESPAEDIKIPEMHYEEERPAKALEKKEVSFFLGELKLKHTTLKYYYLCSFALGTGLRLGELLGLTWDNISFSKKEIYIVRQWKLLSNGKLGFGTLKKENSKRTVPLAQSTLNLLIEYKQHYNITDTYNRVFPFDASAVKRNVKNASKKTGIKASMHTLRHTYATNLIANGIDFKTAAAILGHNVEMTMRIYSHVTDDMMKNAAKKINTIF